jgi:NADH-quinone oxidoreductase subunit D
MDYLSAMNNSLAFVLSVEKLLDIEVPPRGVWMRMIFSELQRIASHLVWLGTHALDIGAMTPFFYCFRERERILDMFEHLSGVRMFPSWIQVGGWRADMPDGLLEKIAKFVEEFPSKVDDYEGLLTENPIWVERTRNIGIITADECIALGINGPILRGSGYAFDLRKANPYLYYDQVEFDIPTGTVGDVYDRFLVRVEEMRQAARIIRQCIERIPEGPVSSDDRKVVPPPREELDNSMESLIHHFKLWTEGFRPPEGEAYVPIEGPKGEIGYYVVSDGSNRPWRVKTRPPCFMNLQALPLMSKGHMVADIVAIIGSIDIVLGEIDR